MNILTPNRGRIGQAVSNTFDKVLSAISSVWLVEHNDDGTHGDVTAESLTVSGDTALSGDLTLDGFVESLDFGDADGSVVVEGDSVTDEFDMSDYPSLASTADLVTPVLETSKPFVPSADDTLSLGFLTAATAGRRFKNGYFSKHVNAKTVNAFAGLYDFDRDKYLGQWTTFTPTLTAATGTWTVGGGDVVTAAYMLVGKMMTVVLVIDTSTNSAITASVSVTIPGSHTATKTVYGVSFISDSGVEANGIVAVVASGTSLIFFKLNSATIAANTDTLYVRCVFTFEIQ